MSRDRVVGVLLGLGVGVTVLCGLWLAVWWLGVSPSKRDPSIGDWFSVVGVLFSGLAFVGVIGTLWLQRIDLELQRAEMKANREELKRQADAQSGAQRALEQQEHQLKKAAQISAVSALLQSVSFARGQESQYTKSRFDKDIARYQRELTRLLADLDLFKDLPMSAIEEE